MKRLALIAGGIVGLLLVTALALPFLIDPNRFRPLLEEKLTQALGREVKLGDLKLSVLSGSVTAADLSIADNPTYSKAPFVQAKSLGVAVELWPLITSRQLHVTGLTIDHPSIALIQAIEASAAKPADSRTSATTGSTRIMRRSGEASCARP